ncbi:MAG: hypothetical protein AAF962_26460 [Actinomycetota bacterium]
MGPRRDPEAVARVRAWVRGEIDDDETTVLVTELACTEPGCPPLETVIGLLGADGQVQHKLHKPLAEVTQADVEGALRAT